VLLLPLLEAPRWTLCIGLGSDLIECGEDLMPLPPLRLLTPLLLPALPSKRVEGGVWAPPVMMLELELSSPSLS